MDQSSYAASGDLARSEVRALAEPLPITAPALVGNEVDYVMECLESTWISARGDFVEAFEAGFSALCGVEHGVAVCNGTAALQLALRALGVEAGDEVIVPALTYVATGGAVALSGANPVFVDSEPQTWNVDPDAVAAAITDRTVGIIAVHLYGHPADIDPLRELADQHGLFLIEDASQAHGASYRGKPVGAHGDVGTFSFYGGKVVTTGEGGMLVTRDAGLSESARQLRSQGEDPNERYNYTELGFNFRLTNVAAAIGLAQIERFDWHLERRRENSARYRARLEGYPGIEMPQPWPWTESIHWLNALVLDESLDVDRDTVTMRLASAGIETRPVFRPLHLQPVFGSRFRPTLPVAERVGARGLCLPSGAALTAAQIDRVVDTLLAALE